MINECKGVRFADLSLQCEQKTQHQLGAEAHRSADVADDDKLWLANAVAMFDLHRDAVVFKVGADGCFRIKLSVLVALLPQCDARAQRRGESFHFALKKFLIRI